ncbi:MAG: TonB family protein [Terricaulis sp.]
MLQQEWTTAALTLDQALALLIPFVEVSDGGPPNVADRAMGQAWAWRSFIDLNSDVPSVTCPINLQRGPAISPLVPMCAGQMHVRPMPNYPRDANALGEEGVVVLWYDIAEDGSLSNIEVLGAMPAGGFPQAVMAVADHWRFVWASDAENCLRHREGAMTRIQFQVR